jgi:hypothetical protein
MSRNKPRSQVSSLSQHWYQCSGRGFFVQQDLENVEFYIGRLQQEVYTWEIMPENYHTSAYQQSMYNDTHAQPMQYVTQNTNRKASASSRHLNDA